MLSTSYYVTWVLLSLNLLVMGFAVFLLLRILWAFRIRHKPSREEVLIDKALHRISMQKELRLVEKIVMDPRSYLTKERVSMRHRIWKQIRDHIRISVED